MKANVGHRSSNLEQKVRYLFHPVYTIDFLCTLADSEDPNIMRHFILVFTVYLYKYDVQRKKCNFFVIKTCDQQYIIMRNLKLESSLFVDNLFFVGAWLS